MEDQIQLLNNQVPKAVFKQIQERDGLLYDDIKGELVERYSGSSLAFCVMDEKRFLLFVVNGHIYKDKLPVTGEKLPHPGNGLPQIFFV